VLALLSPTGFISSFGYVAIFLLCVAQSCCIPTSSELTMGFAGVLAATGHMSLAGAIAVGAGGEVVGAYIAWAVGKSAGRAIVDRYGKYVLLGHHDLDRAEAWYGRHERWGVFGGRLVPVIRNFVALPAGVAEVPAVRFGLLTAGGSLLWDGAMAGIGYGVGSRWHQVVSGFSDAGYVLAVVAVGLIATFFVHRWRSYHRAVAGEQAPLGRSSGLGRAGGGADRPGADRPATQRGANHPAPGPSASSRSARHPAGPGRYPGSRPSPTEALGGPATGVAAPRTPRTLSDKAAEARARRDGTGGASGDS